MIGARALMGWMPSVGPRHGVLLVAAGGLGDAVLLAQIMPRLYPLARTGERITLALRADAMKMAFLFHPGIDVVPLGVTTVLGRLMPGTNRSRFAGRRFRLAVSLDHLRHPARDEAVILACRAEETLAMEPRAWPKHDARLRRNRARYTRLYDSGPDHVDKLLRWTAFANWLTGRNDAPPRVGRALDPEVVSRLPPPAALDRPTVVIQPFSAVREKQHPPETYRRLIAALPDGWEVVLTGAPGDLQRSPEFRALLDLPGLRFDGSGFERLVPVLRAARLVVSVDTALMHLAAALGAPVLCLASAAYVGEIVPYAPEVAPADIRFVYRDMDCRGCLGACIHAAEDGMYPCVARTDADAAPAALRALLAAAEARA